MKYIVADIHGCYEEYRELLRKINFSANDRLYAVGDVVDRGPEPIKVLQDLMGRANATLIMGNHDFIFFTMMKKFAVEIREDNYDCHLSLEDLLDYNLWMQDGGNVTAEQFRKLSKEEREEILAYLAEASLYEVLEHGDKEYILVHAGLSGFEVDKPLEEYELYELFEERADYSRRYYPDENTYLVTGHTPTFLIKGWEKPEAYMENGHIALDCGCVGGGKLAAYCIETGEVTYVDGR